MLRYLLPPLSGSIFEITGAAQASDVALQALDNGRLAPELLGLAIDEIAVYARLGAVLERGKRVVAELGEVKTRAGTSPGKQEADDRLATVGRGLTAEG